MRDVYGPSPDDDLGDAGFDIESVFPFATYEGSWYAIVCGPHALATSSQHPIVSLFQGMDLFFHSFDAMLSTCIDWVRHPDWSVENGLGLSPDVELEIWQRHNPGIFG